VRQHDRPALVIHPIDTENPRMEATSLRSSDLSASVIDDVASVCNQPCSRACPLFGNTFGSQRINSSPQSNRKGLGFLEFLAPLLNGFSCRVGIVRPIDRKVRQLRQEEGRSNGLALRFSHNAVIARYRYFGKGPNCMHGFKAKKSASSEVLHGTGKLRASWFPKRCEQTVRNLCERGDLLRFELAPAAISSPGDIE